MLLILGVLSLFMGVACIIIAGNIRSGQKQDNIECTSIPFIIFGMLIVGIGMGIYCASLGSVADLEAYYDVGVANHIATIQDTERAVIETTEMVGSISVNVPVDNFSQSTNWSNRLKEFREDTANYNNNFQRLNKYNNNWLLNTMFANPPERLKLINISKEPHSDL